jgi:adenylate cyclase
VLLVELSFRGAFLVHRRLLDDQAFNNLTLVLEDLLDEAGVRRRAASQPPAIAFLDLTGYTRMTEQERRRDGGRARDHARGARSG